MKLISAIPILAYLDREETIKFYHKIGFEGGGNWDGYLIFERDEIKIHLWECDNEEIPKNTGCYVNVIGIEKLYSDFLALEIIHPNGKLQEMEWGMKQFSILDNNGNIIHFGESIIN